MEDVVEQLKDHIDKWTAVYVTGAFPNVVGGKVTRVFQHCIELDQENVVAYVPLDRILYVTFPK